MCVFCRIINKEIPSRIVYEDDHVLAIRDLAQVTRGHTLVMPKKHIATLMDCDDDTAAAVIRVIRRLAAQIQQKTGAAGINVLNNNGEAAGQTVDHLHFHIIPRYGSADAFHCEFAESQPQDLDEVLASLQ